MENIIDQQAPRSQTRGELILCTAIAAFGQRGYAGTSLREVAASAGVSLSLLSHHFGSKPGLLDAVVDSLHAASSAHLAELRMSIDQAADAQALVKAWIRYARDVFGHRAGMPYLRLLLRLQSDPEVASEVRFALDKSEPVLKRRLEQLFPLAPSHAVDLAWTAAAGALYAVLVDSDPLGTAVVSRTSQEALLERYLASGLSELLADGSDAT